MLDGGLYVTGGMASESAKTLSPEQLNRVKISFTPEEEVAAMLLMRAFSYVGVEMIGSSRLLDGNAYILLQNKNTYSATAR